MELNKAIYFDRDDICQCGGKIELFNTFNKPVGYSNVLDNNDWDTLLKQKGLNYFKCQKCGRTFGIRWRSIESEWLPRPFREDFLLENFENKFLGDDRL